MWIVQHVRMIGAAMLVGEIGQGPLQDGWPRGIKLLEGNRAYQHHGAVHASREQVSSTRMKRLGCTASTSDGKAHQTCHTNHGQDMTLMSLAAADGRAGLCLVLAVERPESDGAVLRP